MKNEELRIKKIIFALIFISNFLFGYDANSITKAELKQLKKLDREIYKLSIQDSKDNFLEVIHFIYRHLNYNLNYSRLKISSNANLRSSTSKNNYDSGTTTSDRNSGAISISLTYPIFDPKEKAQRQKEIINIKNQITKDVTDYFTTKAEYEELENQNEILKYIEIRDKARKLDGVGSFNDWFSTMKSIKKNRYDTKYKLLELLQKRELLLNYVNPNATEQLKRLLK